MFTSNIQVSTPTPHEVAKCNKNPPKMIFKIRERDATSFRNCHLNNVDKLDIIIAQFPRIIFKILYKKTITIIKKHSIYEDLK